MAFLERLGKKYEVREAAGNRYIIGVCGQLHSGKSTFAKAMKEQFESLGVSAEIIPFAKPLKQIARMMGWDGEKDERGRRLLQVLGTDAGRAYHEDVWVDMWMDCVHSSTADVVIVDDVRFQNEVEKIKSLGGAVYKIVRMGYRPPPDQNMSHESERGVQGETYWLAVPDQDLHLLKLRAADAVRLSPVLGRQEPDPIRGPDNPKKYLKLDRYPCTVYCPHCVRVTKIVISAAPHDQGYCPECWPVELAMKHGRPWED